MLVVSVDGKKTVDDIALYTENGFPVVYAGRGSYAVSIDLHTYHSVVSSEDVHLVYIGRYTSIGENLRIYSDFNHDHQSVYMGVIPEYADLTENASYRERLGQNISHMAHKGTVIIGNDVWIGDNVTIIADVTIGNGAVIGAESVVTKDIPPYTIWCGNPAKCVDNRFSPDMVRGFQQIAWWNFDRSRLKEIENDMKGDPAVFVAKYEPLVKDLEITDKHLITLDEHPSMVAFIDTDTPFPTYGRILGQFIERYCDGTRALFLCYYKDNQSNVDTIDALSGVLTKLPDSVKLLPLAIDPSDDEAVIANADYLVLGRDIKNIQRMNYAFKYGTKCISGVNDPIFL